MSRQKAARQPCGGRAVTKPDAKPRIRQGSRVENTTSIKSAYRHSAEPIATDAEILVGTAMWLERVRSWMVDHLDFAATAEGTPSETVMLRRADLEAFRNGLGQAVSLLDGLTVDPAQFPRPAEPSAAPATTTGRTVH